MSPRTVARTAPGGDERPRLVVAGPEWTERYRSLAAQLRDALGDAFDGGALLDLAHVGSTAVAGLPAKPTLDVLARVHPWPLPVGPEAALLALGYRAHGTHGLPGRSFYTLGGHEVHLHVVGPDGEHWVRHVALRDLLREDAAARDAYAAAKRAALAASAAAPDPERARAVYQDAKGAVVAALEATALERHVERVGFEPLRQLAVHLAGRPGWAVAGGWALDAWRGRPRRVHDDVDLAVDRRQAPALLDALSAAGAEAAWWLPGADEVARYHRHARGAGVPGAAYQAHGRLDGRWLDVVLEPWSDDRWRYRRDPAVGRSIERAIVKRSCGGVDVPVLAPAPVLLLKATAGGRRAPRPKDDEDLRDVLPTMGADDVAWLRDALRRVAPDHPWIADGGALA